MAWNSKSLQSPQTKAANIGPGAPVSMNPGLAGRAYRDGWDIERAYREGVAKVTWVFRCIDAIAGNQARLPVVLRKENSPYGEIVTSAKRSGLLSLLNTKPNDGENSFVFRFRLSSQLLMSTRGVFIEKIRGRDGEIKALHLLPPQSTAPIPHPRKFVSGYEVKLPNGQTITLQPEDVVWVRRPHPLDPYLSMTPMEAAGVAIEIENLAKVYNRNYLLNDGRPGAILNVRGEIDEDDKEELRSRFRGNLNRTGQTTVLSSEDGVDYIDTSASPRDAAYLQMRQITKEEILASFGVPESVIGNAAGRTFSNAAEEIRVFWMETMAPHLETLARALDELDDKYYVDFDTGDVPILVLARQERQRYLMDEFSMGLISANEYRDGAGRKLIESELMDSMLANPNLTPIGNTEKPFETAPPEGAAGAAPPGAMPPGAMPTEAVPPGAPPGAAPPPGAEGMAPVEPAQAAVVGGEVVAPPPGDRSAFPETPPTPGGITQLSVSGALEFKNDLQNMIDVKAERAADRWTEILDRSLERLFERQQRVVLEKAGGAKARRAVAAGSLDVDLIFDQKAWDTQIAQDIRPVIAAIVSDAMGMEVGETEAKALDGLKSVKDFLDAQLERIKQVNKTTKDEIASAILVTSAMDQREDRLGMLKTAIAAVFANLLGKRQRVIAEHEAQTSFNAGTFFAGEMKSANNKTWVTRKDEKVRAAHRVLAGKSIPMSSAFEVAGATLRFPGDPLAPPALTINCRCRLRIN